MHPHHHPLFVNFIVYFNENQDYFECHEVLEEYWKSLPDGGKEHPLTAYILLATGMYHWRRGNPTGAIRTINKALKKFQQFNLQKPSYRREIDYESPFTRCSAHRRPFGERPTLRILPNYCPIS